MCAIAGSRSKKEVKRMLRVMKHRGPDDTGVTVYPHFCVGMDRLSIIDLKSGGLCPYTDSNQTIVFNGEMYNFLELREELKGYGYRFSTDSDTEVVLKAYRQWGIGCLDKFNGMFALAICDGKTIFLARDIAGEKPLYYRRKDFAFASEAKALATRAYNPKDSVFFNAFQYFREVTPYEGVYEILPAHYAIYNIDKDRLEVKRYWEFKERFVNPDPDDAMKELDILLQSATKIRTRSDVGYALYTSGGVDSTLLRTYLEDCVQTISFDSKANNKKDFEKNIEKIVYYLDFPVGSFSSYGLFSLARRAKRLGHKVVISGEGADEVFCGYMRYVPIGVEEQVRQKFPSYKQTFDKIWSGSYAARFALITKRFEYAEYYQELMEPFFANHDPLTAMQLFDFTYILPSLLQMGDRMSAMFGIENRCPFLDRRVIEFGLSLPVGLKMRWFDTKYLVRKLLERRNRDYGFSVEKEKTGLLVEYNKWYGIEGYNRDEYFNHLIKIWKKQNSVR